MIQKISENNFGIYCYEDGKGYLRFALKKLHRFDQPLISFSSEQEARVFMSEKIFTILTVEELKKQEDQLDDDRDRAHNERLLAEFNEELVRSFEEMIKSFESNHNSRIVSAESMKSRSPRQVPRVGACRE